MQSDFEEDPRYETFFIAVAISRADDLRAHNTPPQMDGRSAIACSVGPGDDVAMASPPLIKRENRRCCSDMRVRMLGGTALGRGGRTGHTSFS